MKRGVSLIELVVAMAIFMTVITLAVGAFVTVSRMKALTSNMREAQQKLRIANEMVSRLARQAEKITVTDTKVEMYFDTETEASKTGAKFEISGADLNYSECIAAACTEGTWTTPMDLVGGTMNIDSSSGFSMDGGVPPLLNLTLSGTIPSVTNNPYYSNTFLLKNSLILENVK